MKALILIDIQNDFLPGGSLAVPKGDEILPIIHRVMPHFEHVFATQDWHPPHHASFETLWPVHCVQNTHGAELATELKKDRIEKVFRKGMDEKVDSYSAFFDNDRSHSTGLDIYLRKRGFNDLYFAGLATDYCVLYSVLDAIELSFHVWVIEDACRAIDPTSGKKAIATMSRKGARIIQSLKILAE